LTDISSEMMNSLLPVFVVLHLHMSPMQFGAIDGIYNGFAVAVLSLAGGFIADRTRRPKEVALFGYGLSAICKLLLLGAGATWGWIAAIVALDRTGKGARTAPRDSMISLCTEPSSLALAFGVHRAMDAVGAILGPIIAFVLLMQMPNRFDAVWVTSFAFAILGLAVLALFVQNPRPDREHAANWKGLFSRLTSGHFWKLIAVGLLLSAMTVSDGFLYLLLQRRCNLTLGFFPLFYVVTACFYMLLAIPLGQLADRHGRKLVFFSGYAAIALIYVWLLTSQTANFVAILFCLLLFGFYYAATEGVLTAMASTLIPEQSRTSGLAILGTAVSTGKFCSSLLFGFLWQNSGTQTALSVSLAGLVAALLVSTFFLRKNPAAIRA
jgi:MFS family permease